MSVATPYHGMLAWVEFGVERQPAVIAMLIILRLRLHLVLKEDFHDVSVDRLFLIDDLGIAGNAKVWFDRQLYPLVCRFEYRGGGVHNNLL